MKSKWVKGAAGVCLLAAIAGVGFVSGLAHAEGVPSAGALTYTGYIETPDGKPVTNAVNLTVNVWNAASAGVKVCEVTAENVTPVAGRFQIALPDACATAAKASPNLWLELMVDGSSLGRTKLGAVPYALESGHAVKATEADKASAAVGGLKTTLDGLVPKGTPSAFRVLRNNVAEANNQKIEDGGESVDFLTAELDVGSDFDLATDTFTARTTGVYFLQCSVMYDVSGVVTNYRAKLVIDGTTMVHSIAYGDGRVFQRVASGVFKLTAGAKAQCFADQDAATAAALYDKGGEKRIAFEGFRIPGVE